MKFDLDIVIDRAVDDVFAYVTDVRNLPEWQESAVEAAWIEGNSPRVGARLRERRGLLGRAIESEVEVTAYEPGRRFDLRALSGPIRFEVRHGETRKAPLTDLLASPSRRCDRRLSLAACREPSCSRCRACAPRRSRP